MLNASSEAPAGSMRELLQVSFPLIISSGSLSLMNVVDRAFLARVGVDALAASMPAVMLSWTSMSLAFGIAGYTNAFLSQYEGAGRKESAASALWQGIFLAVIGGVTLLPLIPLAPLIFAAMGHDPDVQALQAPYFAVLCPVAIPVLLSTVLSSFFTARKRTSVVMWVNVTTSLLNMALDYLLIFGWGSWSGWGMNGAAAATVISSAAGALMLAGLLVLEARAAGYPMRRTCRPDWSLLRRMVRYGFPNGVQMFLDVGAFTLFIILIGRLGKAEQAATNLAFTLNSLAFVPLMGLGTAVLTLVGLRVGEGRPELATRTVWDAFLLSGGFMIIFAVIYLSLPDLILAPFMHGESGAEFQELRPIVVSLLKFVALYTFFDAMGIVFGSAVRGAGDTMFSLVFTVATGWLLMVAPTVWIVRTGGDLYACWAACTAFVIVLGLGFLARFQQGRWRQMRVIEPTFSPVDEANGSAMTMTEQKESTVPT